jgi:uncharacterized membrane protein YbhN (UPF0104 family)
VPQRSADARRHWVRLARAGAVLLLLAAAAWHFDAPAALDAFGTEHLVALLAAQPLQLLTLWVVTVRFWALVPGPRPPVGRTFAAYVLSVGLNNLLPGRLAELTKVTYLSRGGTPYSGLTSAVLLERYADAVLLAALLCIGFGGIWVETDPVWLVALGAGSLAVLLSLPRLRPGVKRLAAVIPLPAVRRFLGAAYDSLGRSARTPQFAASLALGLVGWATGFLVIWTVLGVADGVSARVALATYAALAVGRAIPGLPGGLGTYEAAAVLALTHFGYAFEEALPLALTMHASQAVLPTLGGVVLLAFGHTGAHKAFADLRASLRAKPPPAVQDDRVPLSRAA